LTWAYECVKALEKSFPSNKELIRTLYNPLCVEAFGFEVFQIVYKAVVCVWVVRELDLNLIQEANCSIEEVSIVIYRNPMYQWLKVSGNHVGFAHTGTGKTLMDIRK
jgi:hypothetical protein